MSFPYKTLLRHLLAFMFFLGIINCGGGGDNSSESSTQSSTSSPNGAGSQNSSNSSNASNGTNNSSSGGTTGNSSSQSNATPTLITVENAKPGTADWQLSTPALSHEIEGYASATSVNRGERIDLMVNTSASSFNVDIYRMGWYGGAGARLMKSFTDLPRKAQPMPCLNPNGVIECNWLPNVSITVPTADSNPASPGYWASGVYLAKLSTNASPSKQSYIIFVVRDDARTATYVSQLPVTTYQAYNYWGGKSLYTGCEVHDRMWRCADNTPPANSVSFNRPYGKSSYSPAAIGVGAGEFLTNVQPVEEGTPISSAGFDYNLLRWMEKQGYDVKYITNLDLHENNAVLSQAKAFISSGHDEYYSKAMWDNLLAARGTGINLAFFSANQIYWQVRFSDGIAGPNKRNRIMTCYRSGGDPVTDNNLTTNQFRWLGRPEAALVGSQYGIDAVLGDMVITNPAHWLFAGTGATGGMLIKGVLGYEINAMVPGVSPAQTRLLAHSPWGNTASDMTYYVDASSSQVFSTGTIQWSWGLDDYIPNGTRQNYTSSVVQIFTANVFAAMGEKNLSVFTNVISNLDLSTPASLEPAQVTQNNAPTGTRKNNQWRLVESGDLDYYFIVSRANGLCLASDAASNGNQVRTQDCRVTDNMKWRLNGTGSSVALIEKQQGKCLDVPGGSNTEGIDLVVAGCSGVPSQQWVRK